MDRIRVLVFGLGPIGCQAAALAARKPGLEVAGAVDKDPTKAGRDLGELCGEELCRGVTVQADAAEALAAVEPDVVIHCTSSFIPRVKGQYLAILEHGASIVSSTEEMLWPRLQHPQAAAEIDEAAQSAGATVLGTGVNPGFVMDVLPALASSVLAEVRRVVCRRHVDASTRRRPFQQKIGAGLSEPAFRELAAAAQLGHVGLRESIALLAAALGFELDEISQTVDPILAEHEVATEHVRVARGQVAGIANRGFGKRGTEVWIEMDLRMYVGCPDPFDEAEFDSDPPLRIRIPGGTFGDTATAAMLVNCVPLVAAAPPGLKTMLDLPLPRYRA